MAKKTTKKPVPFRTFSVRLPVDVYEKLVEIARTQHRGLGSQIHCMIEKNLGTL